MHRSSYHEGTAQEGISVKGGGAARLLERAQRNRLVQSGTREDLPREVVSQLTVSSDGDLSMCMERI